GEHERLAGPLEALDGDEDGAEPDGTGQSQDEPAFVVPALERQHAPAEQETAGKQDDRVGDRQLEAGRTARGPWPGLLRTQIDIAEDQVDEEDGLGSDEAGHAPPGGGDGIDTADRQDLATR